MSDLVERLREYASDDHERLCEGREYTCSCGYDDKRDPLLKEAADRIEQLEAALRFYAGWPQGPAGNIAPLLIDAGYKARAALGEDRT